MLQIKLGDHRTIDAATDCLGRSEVGWYPEITEHDAWDAGRGVWKLKPERALAQDEAQIISPDGTIVAVARITGIKKCHDRFAVEGTLLTGDARVGQPTTTPHLSRNPVGYF